MTASSVAGEKSTAPAWSAHPVLAMRSPSLGGGRTGRSRWSRQDVGMPSPRIRLSDAEVTAIARYHFGISGAPELPEAVEFEDAQGVPVATSAGGRLDVL